MLLEHELFIGRYNRRGRSDLAKCPRRLMISAGTECVSSLEICSSKLLLDFCKVKQLHVSVLFPKLVYGVRLNFVLRFANFKCL